MSRRTCPATAPRLPTRRAAAAAVCLAFALATPAATASCGDYLRPPAGHPAPSHREGPASPCTGPHCSPAPLDLPTPPPPVPPEPWALGVGTVDAVAPGDGGRWDEESRSYAPRRGAPPDPPPR